MSLGDFAAIDAAHSLDKASNIMFWCLFVVTVVVTMIIFLNFIVAEASASYQKVTDTLEAVIQQEKASLIHGAEAMMPLKYKTDQRYPQFLIVRDLES